MKHAGRMNKAGRRRKPGRVEGTGSALLKGRLDAPGTWPLSAWLLIAVNLLPVAGVVLLDWQVMTVLVLFWLENLMVGVAQLMRMTLTASRPAQKLSTMAFFVLHYGGFALGHGFAVLHFFGPDQASGVTLDMDPWALWSFVREQGLVLAALAMTISHAVSFLLNDLSSPTLRARSAANVMSMAYQRVVVLHITILVGGFLVAQLGSPLWALLVLVALKTLLDLKGHLARVRDVQPVTATA